MAGISELMHMPISDELIRIKSDELDETHFEVSEVYSILVDSDRYYLCPICGNVMNLNTFISLSHNNTFCECPFCSHSYDIGGTICYETKLEDLALDLYKLALKTFKEKIGILALNNYGHPIYLNEDVVFIKGTGAGYNFGHLLKLELSD